jgi:large subunit ribosomal protein L15
MKLDSLKPAKGSRQGKKRIGRGEGSGWGITAGRGEKGAKSRSGHKKRAWFEGGQMPLQRRLPKYGFTNIHKKTFQVVNISSLEQLADQKEITIEKLYEKGLVRKKNIPVKVLGNGELKSKVNIKVNAVSKSAREKIEKLGGTVTVL